jgi:hypothetical protein
MVVVILEKEKDREGERKEEIKGLLMGWVLLVFDNNF